MTQADTSSVENEAAEVGMTPPTQQAALTA